MRDLKTEILFNRALLWAILAEMAEPVPLRAFFALLSLQNVFRSIMEVDE